MQTLLSRYIVIRAPVDHYDDKSAYNLEEFADL